jgi:UDP-N-acetylmuramoylalanine--D-glutamate ligase
MIHQNVDTVVILGLARQGTALARYFASRGARVIVSDLRSGAELQSEIEGLRAFEIEYVLGEHPLSLLDRCDLLCLSGGIPLGIPIVKEALRRGIRLSSDAQIFIRRCPADVVGITGSAGKTTTTTLVGRMLAASGHKTWVGGNIGNPLIDEIAQIAPTDRVVVELSSFQLELVTCSPKIAGVLNITPNHLDRHGTMAAYFAAKRNIVAYQRPGDVAVLGYDEPNARSLSRATLAEVRYFSGCETLDAGAFLADDTLMLNRRGERVEVCKRDEINLRGFHNVLNVLAAATLADAAGASLAGMRTAIREFTGVAHRLEVVRERDGVLWVNDSIATAPERVIAALDAFEEPIVLLVGGRDKDLPWGTFARRVLERVRVLILFGEAAPLIEAEIREAQDRSPERVGVLERVVKAGSVAAAVRWADDLAGPGDVVLLSPGGTSFDAYRDFAERGEHFKELVHQL